MAAFEAYTVINTTINSNSISKIAINLNFNNTPRCLKYFALKKGVKVFIKLGTCFKIWRQFPITISLQFFKQKFKEINTYNWITITYIVNYLNLKKVYASGNKLSVSQAYILFLYHHVCIVTVIIKLKYIYLIAFF